MTCHRCEKCVSQLEVGHNTAHGNKRNSKAWYTVVHSTETFNTRARDNSVPAVYVSSVMTLEHPCLSPTKGALKYESTIHWELPQSMELLFCPITMKVNGEM
jgi:hypothetical protein